MKELMEIDKVRQILVGVYNELRTVGCSLQDLRYEEGGRFMIDDKTKFYLTDDTTNELCSVIGISKHAFTKSDDELKRMIVRKLLDDRESNLILRDDNGTLVCDHFLDTKSVYLSPLQVFDIAVDVLKECDPQVVLNTEHGLVSFDFVTNEETKVKKVGDVVRAGMTVDMRVVGMRQQISVGPFAYTLRCSNGVIGRRDDLSTVKVEKLSDFENVIRASVNKMYGLSKDDLLENLVKLAEKTVHDPSQLLHRSSKEYGVGRHKDRLLDMIPSLGENPNHYKIIDMITSYANEVSSLRTRRKIQGFAGYLTLNSECRCKLCKSKLL